MVISLFRVELSLPRWDGRWAHQFPLPDSFIKPKYKRCLRHQDLLVSCRHTEIDWTILLSMHTDAAIKNLQNSIMNVSLEKYRAEFLIPALPWWVPSPGESTKGKVSSTFSAKPCHRLQFTSLPSFFTWMVEDVSKNWVTRSDFGRRAWGESFQVAEGPWARQIGDSETRYIHALSLALRLSKLPIRLGLTQQHSRSKSIFR